MAEPDQAAMRQGAGECVALVAKQYGRRLDYSPQSLDDLDDVCGRLLADGPLAGDRWRLWWMLISIYTGEVVIRTLGGVWIEDETTSGGFAVATHGLTAFPFSTVQRVLDGEPYKSLGSFLRGLTAFVEQGGTEGGN